MTLKDAIKSSLTILKQVMEEKLNATNIEVIHKGITTHGHVKYNLILKYMKVLTISTSLPAACHNRAWQDLPHVHKRRAWGCHQGYLELNGALQSLTDV